MKEADPSLALSPYTRRRLRMAQTTGRLTLVEASVVRVAQKNKSYVVYGNYGEQWRTATPPILATGFMGSLELISELFDWHPELYYPLLTEADESTIVPGLFLSGPMVRHQNLIFCFIYKFRQRFAIIANTIGEQLGLDTTPLQTYRLRQMYLDDLSCCDETCAC